ncbi:MAG: DNA replication and repair protein RecF [Deltaproteobacteria bacterium]|nr:DNA replication and repair protein RecF [Deltaproteobacteria bacterium]
MRLLRVGTTGFRNLVPAVIDVDAPIVAFCGPNGQGKTNWLEAVGVLGTLRSFRTARPAEILRHGALEAAVEGYAESEGFSRRFTWSWGEGGRGLRREDRNVDAVAWLRSLRASYFVPADVGIVRGEPTLRRALLDRASLTLEPSYLSLSQQCRRALEQKAALVRSGRADGPTLDAIDEQLSALIVRVVSRRADTVAAMAGRMRDFHAAFGAGESCAVRYRPNLAGDAETVLRALHAARPGERDARRLLAGPQRDDLELLVDGKPARAYASQGQARSLVLAWKLAELASAWAEGETPLFLVDDVGSELDPGRTSRLVHTLGTLGAQVFLTTTDRRFLPVGIDGMRVLEVEAGVARLAQG